MKKIKKIFALFALVSLFVTSGPLASAATTSLSPSEVSKDVSTTIELRPIVTDIVPRATFYGTAGSISVNYMASNKSVSWRVNVPKAAYFSGGIKVTTLSTNKSKYYYIYGGLSGVVNISVKKGTRYKIEMIGSAYNYNDQYIAKTVPNSITITA